MAWYLWIPLVIELLTAILAFLGGREQAKASIGRRVMEDAMLNGGKPTPLGIVKAIRPREHRT